MNDPFGTQHNGIILSAENDQITKKEKKVDMVKIFLASVPYLEDSKDALSQIVDTVQDDEVKKKVEGFINSILKITEDILDLTKVAIRGVRQETSIQEDLANKTITPEMISAKPPQPEKPVV